MSNNSTIDEQLRLADSEFKRPSSEVSGCSIREIANRRLRNRRRGQTVVAIAGAILLVVWVGTEIPKSGVTGTSEVVHANGSLPGERHADSKDATAAELTAKSLQARWDQLHREYEFLKAESELLATEHRLTSLTGALPTIDEIRSVNHYAQRLYCAIDRSFDGELQRTRKLQQLVGWFPETVAARKAEIQLASTNQVN